MGWNVNFVKEIVGAIGGQRAQNKPFLIDFEAKVGGNGVKIPNNEGYMINITRKVSFIHEKGQKVRGNRDIVEKNDPKGPQKAYFSPREL